jgi:hypothetical protein
MAFRKKIMCIDSSNSAAVRGHCGAGLHLFFMSSCEGDESSERGRPEIQNTLHQTEEVTKRPGWLGLHTCVCEMGLRGRCNRSQLVGCDGVVG